MPDDARADAVAGLQNPRPNDPELARLVLLHPQADRDLGVPALTLAYAQQQFRSAQHWHNVRVRWRALVVDYARLDCHRNRRGCGDKCYSSRLNVEFQRFDLLEQAGVF
jgi:hypothetical protein